MTLKGWGHVLLALYAVTLLGGCLGRTAPRMPMGVLQFEPLKKTEYQILADAEGTATVGHFLIFPFGDWKLSGSVGPDGRFASGATRAAMYKAIESVPGADALLAPRTKGKTIELLIFGTSTVTVKGKAIKILK